MSFSCDSTPVSRVNEILWELHNGMRVYIVNARVLLLIEQLKTKLRCHNKPKGQ